MGMHLVDDSAGIGFELLEEDECFSLLGQSPIGRVAVSIGALPAVFPVNYVMADRSVYFLTGEGTKLTAALRGATVAFEVDRFDVQFHQGWSVLVIGEARVVADDEAVAVRKWLALEPWAPGGRDRLVRIQAEFVSGRRIGFAEPDTLLAAAAVG